jgi:hypothetical protein
VLAISLETDAEMVRKAASRLSLQMPVLIAQGEMLAPLGVRAIPSTVFVDRNGVIVAAATGPRELDYFEARAKELLGLED